MYLDRFRQTYVFHKTSVVKNKPLYAITDICNEFV